MSVILDVYRLTVTWVAVLALMALGRRFLWFEIPLLRWGNEGAYPIYLPHQSVIVVVAYLLLEAWDAPAVTGWAVVTVVSIAVTVAVYEWFVRPWNPVRVLFGMKPRVARAPGVPALRS
jgi:peptidoglycan/LPS O-acetylase OafA/YrhL